MDKAKLHEDAKVQETLDVLNSVARNIGRQLGGRYLLDDLKGFAHEVILDLIGRFDPARGISFRAYARIRLRGAIIDGLRRDSGLPRALLARLLSLEAGDLYIEQKAEENASVHTVNAEMADARFSSFLRSLATAYATGLVARDPELDTATDFAPDEQNPEAHMRRSESRKVLEKAIDSIGEPEATILKRHYFLDEDLHEAAAHVGLSKSWGSRLHARGIEKLALKLARIKEDI